VCSIILINFVKVELLRDDIYRDSTAGFDIDAVSSGELIVRNANENTSMTISFISEIEPENISWKSPGVLHVIECSGVFNTFTEASRHLHIGRTHNQELELRRKHGIRIWDEGGAMKVLIASPSSSSVSTFDPGVNERDCKFQDHVVGCAPPKHSEKESDLHWDLENDSRQVLKLLSGLRVTS